MNMQADSCQSKSLQRNVIYILNIFAQVSSSLAGLNLIIWLLCGLIAMGGALCFAELGTLVKESGGQWAYIRRGIGDAPAFISAWMNIILNSVSTSVLALSSGEYVVLNFTKKGCQTPVSMVFFLNIAKKCNF